MITKALNLLTDKNTSKKKKKAFSGDITGKVCVSVLTGDSTPRRKKT